MQLRTVVFCSFSCSILMMASSGCRTFWPPAHEGTELNGVPLRVDYDATRRGVYFVPRPKKDGESPSYYLVTEPPPDVALGVIADITAKVKTDSMDAEASAKFSEQVIELGKRTQAVMVLREGLFRLQEGYANGVITKDVYMVGFGQILSAAESIALAEIKDPAVASKQADANKARAEGFKVQAEGIRAQQQQELIEKENKHPQVPPPK